MSYHEHEQILAALKGIELKLRYANLIRANELIVNIENKTTRPLTDVSTELDFRRWLLHMTDDIVSQR